MTEIDINDIDRLLQRFFDGFTSLDEEAALERFFAESKRLPRRLERYRPMFAWYAGGMPVSALPSPRRRGKAVVWISSVAAAAAMAIISVGALRSPCDTSMLASTIADSGTLTEETYVIRDGHRITNPSEVAQEITETILEVEEMDFEMEMRKIEMHNYQ